MASPVCAAMAPALNVSALLPRPAPNRFPSFKSLRTIKASGYRRLHVTLREQPLGPLLNVENPEKLFTSLGLCVAQVGLLAAVGASLCFADPAAAFKGGGPYGSEVTRGQDLTGKDFSGKSLNKQDFKTSILRQANFKGAKLLGASFFDADLTGANLSDADLRGADLSLANITKYYAGKFNQCKPRGALATGNTSFRGAKITGADFTDVPLRGDQREYLCKDADGVNPTTGNATRETLLCE